MTEKSYTGFGRGTGRKSSTCETQALMGNIIKKDFQEVRYSGMC